MAVGRERKTGNVTISTTKTGAFDTQRTLSGSFFAIPERLASIRAVVLVYKLCTYIMWIHRKVE